MWIWVFICLNTAAVLGISVKLIWGEVTNDLVTELSRLYKSDKIVGSRTSLLWVAVSFTFKTFKISTRLVEVEGFNSFIRGYITGVVLVYCVALYVILLPVLIPWVYRHLAKHYFKKDLW